MKSSDGSGLRSTVGIKHNTRVTAREDRGLICSRDCVDRVLMWVPVLPHAERTESHFVGAFAICRAFRVHRRTLMPRFLWYLRTRAWKLLSWFAAAKVGIVSLHVFFDREFGFT